MEEIECKQFVEELRAMKFRADNPLAPDMHQAIRQLAAELYQKDLNFVMELVQNADDNTYAEGVVPKLEFVLVERDLAGVGVEWTLLVLNNEVGFSTANINSLCSIGRSTKKGKRNSGYIGEKGIGFKSVFLVTRHPIVISNGFHIRFNEAPPQGTELGYIVPEWAEQPTDADLMDCLGTLTLPNTTIVLPIRRDKVLAMREQLFQISPQLVLFLHKIEKLSVRQLSASPKTMSVRRRTMRAPPSCWAVIPNSCKYAKVRLSFGDREASYHVWQQEFPAQADHGVDHRHDVETWVITLAFPQCESAEEKSIECAREPDIYAFLPTKLTAGFPFLINADFLVVASRESIHFDSKWNKGIMSCIPHAFISAFTFFLKAAPHMSSVPLSQLRSMYSYIPVRRLLLREFEHVKEAILENLNTQDTILCDGNVGQRFPEFLGNDRLPSSTPFLCPPSMARTVRAEFRELLKEAHEGGIPTPNLLTSQRFYLVDADLAEDYHVVLSTLKVQPFTPTDYIECLRSPKWLESLPESLYVRALSFLASSVGTHQKALQDFPLVKYLDGESRTKLLAPGYKNEVPIYMSAMARDEHFLSTWRPLFQRWMSVHFMPRKTVQVICELPEQEQLSLRDWLTEIANVTELSVGSYLQSLARKCEKKSSPTDLALGIIHFILHATHDGYLNNCQSIISKLPLIDYSGIVFSNCTRPILLPGSVSKWPRLLLCGTWKVAVLCLSERYLELPSFIANDIGNHYVIQFLKQAVRATDIFEIMSPPDAPLYTGPPWGEHAEDIRCLLAWLSGLVYIPQRLKTSLKDSEWVKTLNHGKKKPSSCFLDSRQWSGVLHQNDVPFVDTRFYGNLKPYSSILRDLGMVISLEDGANAVAQHVAELSRKGSGDIQTDTAIRWYTYLKMQNWKDRNNRVTSASDKMIWVPMGRHSSASWRSPLECVIQDSGGLFHERLCVLEKYYKDEDILLFFQYNMGVAPTPGVEKYCELWIDRGENRRKVTKEDCENAWGIIAQGWVSFAATGSWEVENFKKRCRIPCINDPLMSTTQADRLVELVRPEGALYADNLVLAETFGKANPRPQFAWLPSSAAAASWVEALVKCYTDLGVAKLSDALEGGGPICYTSKARHSSSKVGEVGKGMYRAILGYLADPKHKLSAQTRKRMVMQLQNVEVCQVQEVGEVKYRVAVDGRVYEATRTAHVRWEKGEQRIYVAMPSGCNKVKVAHELASDIAKGVVGGERVGLAQGLEELLLLAAGFSFNDDAVKELLCIRNLRLCMEDEALLMKLLNNSSTLPWFPY